MPKRKKKGKEKKRKKKKRLAVAMTDRAKRSTKGIITGTSVEQNIKLKRVGSGRGSLLHRSFARTSFGPL